MSIDPIDIVERAGIGFAMVVIAGTVAWVGITAIAVLADW